MTCFLSRDLLHVTCSHVTRHVRPHGAVDKVPCVWHDGIQGEPHPMGKSPLYCHVKREHAALHAMLNVENGGQYWCDRNCESAYNWRLGKVTVRHHASCLVTGSIFFPMPCSENRLFSCCGSVSCRFECVLVCVSERLLLAQCDRCRVGSTCTYQYIHVFYSGQPQQVRAASNSVRVLRSPSRSESRRNRMSVHAFIPASCRMDYSCIISCT